ncbi:MULTISPECIES: metallophosphoesterase family protein [unclassified Agarivorans]|uniref:metallophosphoesterase family protein n=1 Tax=unclassified Agarivorans TaxID=2636026 RepID=UPI003D7DD82E
MTNFNRRKFLKTTALLGSTITLGHSLSACHQSSSSQSRSASDTLRFAVLSDPHVYNLALGTTGQALENYLAEDRKMLLQSGEILSAIVQQLLQQPELDALLIPGDLTKDGELVCHQKALELLQPLRDAGKKVYVIPGNHDINNPDAVSFNGDTTSAVETVNAEQFASLYADFGYQQALYRHDNSLSYIAEPTSGVWLVALDSCKYQDNASLGSPETSGALSDDLLGWLQPLLTEAQAQNKLVFGMQHHGLVAHFASQRTIFPEYLIDDYESVGAMLAAYGLNLVFTGHFHAQDVSMADYNGDGSTLLYDVETGSTVTAPCPYRLVDVNIANQSFNISSLFIDSITSMSNFAEYKENFINQGMLSLYRRYLAQMGLTGDSLNQFASLAASLHVAHYKGDESTETSTLTTLQALASSPDANTAYLGNALLGLAVDPGLSDNQLALSLSGESIALFTLIKRVLHRKALA